MRDHPSSGIDGVVRHEMPRGITAIGVFLFFGATMASLDLLSATLALAGAGWFKRRLWGWRLAVAVIATQALGDLVNFLRGDFLRGGVGFGIAAALLSYLLRPVVRAVFNGATLP